MVLFTGNSFFLVVLVAVHVLALPYLQILRSITIKAGANAIIHDQMLYLNAAKQAEQQVEKTANAIVKEASLLRQDIEQVSGFLNDERLGKPPAHGWSKPIQTLGFQLQKVVAAQTADSILMVEIQGIPDKIKSRMLSLFKIHLEDPKERMAFKQSVIDLVMPSLDILCKGLESANERIRMTGKKIVDWIVDLHIGYQHPLVVRGIIKSICLAKHSPI